MGTSVRACNNKQNLSRGADCSREISLSTGETGNSVSEELAVQT